MIEKIITYANNDINDSSEELSGHLDKEVAVHPIEGQDVILKYDSNGRLVHVYEYLGSELARKIGISAQRTELAFRTGRRQIREECVAIDKFENKLYLIANKLTHLTGNDKEVDITGLSKFSKNYSLDSLFNKYPTELCVADEQEWVYRIKEVIAYDIVIGNTDRHQSNLGFFNTNGKIELAPMFDNGNSFNNKKPFDTNFSRIFTKETSPYYSSIESIPLLMTEVYDQMCSMFNGFNKEVMHLFKLARTESIISGILRNIVEYNNEYYEIEERVITYLKEKEVFYANKQMAK